jgi:Glycosyltransferase sugar-binding region containing DXD motif
MPIQSLWIGRISTMERLSIQSYISNGHEFHLYAYEPLENLPSGVVLKDANEIMPKEKVGYFTHLQQAADWFRIALLLKRGGWWVDLDSVCLKPFDFPEDYVFCEAAAALRFVQNNPIKVPPQADVMKYCFSGIKDMTKEGAEKISFHKIGPELLRRAVSHLRLDKYIQPREVFDPIRWDNIYQVIDPEIQFDLSRSYAVHFFHAAWNQGCQADKHSISPQTDGHYPEGCLYEQLKRRYGIE